MLGLFYQQLSLQKLSPKTVFLELHRLKISEITSNLMDHSGNPQAIQLCGKLCCEAVLGHYVHLGSSWPPCSNFGRSSQKSGEVIPDPRSKADHGSEGARITARPGWFQRWCDSFHSPSHRRQWHNCCTFSGRCESFKGIRLSMNHVLSRLGH
jgi:hypothetical protein